MCSKKICYLCDNMNDFSHKRPNVAALLAGGRGSRLGAERPKQYLGLGGRLVIEHTVEAFERAAGVDEIVIVAAAEFCDELRRLAAARPWRKLRAVVAGGAERADSSRAAIAACGGRDVNLLLHDAARPLVPQRVISDVCRALLEHRAVCAALPAVDTVALTDGGVIRSIPPRQGVMHLQTPQAFRLADIARAYALAAADPAFRATDDCGVLLRYAPEVPLVCVPGSARNLKLTFADDLARLEQLLHTPE